VGQSVRANGFWLCARSDLVTRRFYVADRERYYRVQNGSTVAQRPAGRSECRGTSRQLANGFWVCMEGAPPRSAARVGPARSNRCPPGFRLYGVDLCGRSDLVTRTLYLANAGTDGSCNGYVASGGSWLCIKGP
jgi:hypothetical protein